MADQNLQISEKLFQVIQLQNDVHTKNESVLFDNVKKLGEQVDDDIELMEGKKIKIESTDDDSVIISVKDNETFCLVNNTENSFSGESLLSFTGEILQNDFELNDNVIVLNNNSNYSIDIQLEFSGKSEKPVVSVAIPVFNANNNIIEKSYSLDNINTVLNINALLSKIDNFYIKVNSKTKITAKIKYLQIVEL